VALSLHVIAGRIVGQLIAVCVMFVGLPISAIGQAAAAARAMSSRFSQALKQRHIQLITYREVIHQQGLQAMRRPEG